jgi:isoleucyl-tRNA synthetase
MKKITISTILALVIIAVPNISFGAGPCYAYLGYEFKGVDEIKQVNCVEWGSGAYKTKAEAEQARSNYLQKLANSKAEAEIIEAEKQPASEVIVDKAVQKETVTNEEKERLEAEQAKQIAELTAILQSLIVQLAELKAKLGVI